MCYTVHCLFCTYVHATHSWANPYRAFVDRARSRRERGRRPSQDNSRGDRRQYPSCLRQPHYKTPAMNGSGSAREYSRKQKSSLTHGKAAQRASPWLCMHASRQGVLARVSVCASVKTSVHKKHTCSKNNYTITKYQHMDLCMYLSTYIDRYIHTVYVYI